MAVRASAQVAGSGKPAAERRLVSDRWFRFLATTAIAASVAGIFFAVPHTTEDFVYHVPRTRFHLNNEFSLWLWAGLAAVQVGGVALASARKRSGFVLVALTGLAWTLATALDHTGDVFLRQPWRDSPSSTIWVVGTALANVAAAGAGSLVAVLWLRDESQGPRRPQGFRPRDPGLNG